MQTQPPKDVPPSELFLKLMERPVPSEVLDFPAKMPGGTPLPRIRILVLRMDQHDDCRIRAREYLKSKRKLTDGDLATHMGGEILGDAVARELLAVAVVTEEQIGTDNLGAPVYGRVFRGAEDVNRLTADEIVILFNAYLVVQHKWGPFEVFAGTKEEQDAWISRLQEGAAALPLLDLPLPRLVDLLSSLAGRIYSLSHILGSQLESLPTTLASALEPYLCPTSYFGEPRESTTGETSSASSPDTLDLATRMADEQRAKSQG